MNKGERSKKKTKREVFKALNEFKLDPTRPYRAPADMALYAYSRNAMVSRKKNQHPLLKGLHLLCNIILSDINFRQINWAEQPTTTPLFNSFLLSERPTRARNFMVHMFMEHHKNALEEIAWRRQMSFLVNTIEQPDRIVREKITFDDGLFYLVMTGLGNIQELTLINPKNILVTHDEGLMNSLKRIF